MTAIQAALIFGVLLLPAIIVVNKRTTTVGDVGNCFGDVSEKKLESVVCVDTQTDSNRAFFNTNSRCLHLSNGAVTSIKGTATLIEMQHAGKEKRSLQAFIYLL